jgi:hypothetical protein
MAVMKNSLLFLTLFLGLMACSKKNEDTATPASDTYMKATVDGKSLNVTGTGTPTDTRGTTSIFQQSNSTFYLTGNNGTIILSMAVDKFPKTTGSFTIGDINSGRIGNYVDNTDAANPINYYSKSGTLNITKFDGKTVEGSFTFTATNTTLKKDVVVSNGTFKVGYTEI